MVGGLEQCQFESAMCCTRRKRLAKSSAKLNLRSEVTAWDAIFAIHLYEETLLLRTGTVRTLLYAWLAVGLCDGRYALLCPVCLSV